MLGWVQDVPLQIDDTLQFLKFKQRYAKMADK